MALKRDGVQKLTKPRCPWGEERSLVREWTNDCDNCDGTTRFVRSCISMLSRVFPFHGRQRHNNWTRQNRGSHLFLLFRKVISPFRYFVISCFKHARVNETQSNINMIAAIYHQSAVWINFYDHSWLFHQSLKYRSMLRVSWTEHKTNEEVLKMANTTRSSLPIIKKRKCLYFGDVIRARSIRLNIGSGILS